MLAGTFNGDLKALTDTNLLCSACPGGRTNDRIGATAENQCDQCMAGYAGTNCGTVCGGGAGENATYKAAGSMDGSGCDTCPAMVPGFYYAYSGSKFYTPRSLTRPGASSATQCVAEFAQLGELNANWYLDGNATMTNDTATNLEDCVEACRSDQGCQYITFDYAPTASKCQLKTKPSSGVDT